MKDTNSLSHTSYRCKYHIVIIPKYRRMVIYNKLRKDIGQILRMLIERKPGCKLLEAEACPDHTHMLLEIPPKYSISEFMGYLKSKSTLMIFERHANMKYKFGNRKFWSRGYFVDTVEKMKKQYEKISKTSCRKTNWQIKWVWKNLSTRLRVCRWNKTMKKPLWEAVRESVAAVRPQWSKWPYATIGPYRAGSYHVFQAWFW